MLSALHTEADILRRVQLVLSRTVEYFTAKLSGWAQLYTLYENGGPFMDRWRLCIWSLEAALGGSIKSLWKTLGNSNNKVEWKKMVKQFYGKPDAKLAHYITLLKAFAADVNIISQAL